MSSRAVISKTGTATLDLRLTADGLARVKLSCWQVQPELGRGTLRVVRAPETSLPGCIPGGGVEVTSGVSAGGEAHVVVGVGRRGAIAAWSYGGILIGRYARVHGALGKPHTPCSAARCTRILGATKSATWSMIAAWVDPRSGTPSATPAQRLAVPAPSISAGLTTLAVARTAAFVADNSRAVPPADPAYVAPVAFDPRWLGEMPSRTFAAPRPTASLRRLGGPARWCAGRRRRSRGAGDTRSRSRPATRASGGRSAARREPPRSARAARSPTAAASPPTSRATSRWRRPPKCVSCSPTRVSVPADSPSAFSWNSTDRGPNRRWSTWPTAGLRGCGPARRARASTKRSGMRAPRGCSRARDRNHGANGQAWDLAGSARGVRDSAAMWPHAPALLDDSSACHDDRARRNAPPGPVACVARGGAAAAARYLRNTKRRTSTRPSATSRAR